MKKQPQPDRTLFDDPKPRRQGKLTDLKPPRRLLLEHVLQHVVNIGERQTATIHVRIRAYDGSTELHCLTCATLVCTLLDTDQRTEDDLIAELTKHECWTPRDIQ